MAVKRTRAVAAYLVLSALAVPSAWAAPPEPGTTAAAAGVPADAPTGVPSIAPRAGVPELLPDPDPHPSTAPGEGPEARGHGIPSRPDSTARPTREDRDALLARVAAIGIQPVVDVAGVPALTVDHELVLFGGPDGVDAMRAAGIEVAPGPRPGVSAVRSGGRMVAWYVENGPTAPPESPVPTPSGSAEPPPEPPGTGLPQTGLGVTAQLAALGLLLVVGGTTFVRLAARRRRRRS